MLILVMSKQGVTDFVCSAIYFFARILRPEGAQFAPNSSRGGGADLAMAVLVRSRRLRPARPFPSGRCVGIPLRNPAGEDLLNLHLDGHWTRAAAVRGSLERILPVEFRPGSRRPMLPVVERANPLHHLDQLARRTSLDSVQHRPAGQVNSRLKEGLLDRLGSLGRPVQTGRNAQNEKS